MFSTLTCLKDGLQSFLEFLCPSAIMLKNEIQPWNPNLEVEHNHLVFLLSWKNNIYTNTRQIGKQNI
jgi:hypothetical protein